MVQAFQHSLVCVEVLQFAPAGLTLPVPAHRARSCSTRSPRNVSRTIERAALGTETDSPAHSCNVRTSKSVLPGATTDRQMRNISSAVIEQSGD